MSDRRDAEVEAVAQAICTAMGVHYSLRFLDVARDAIAALDAVRARLPQPHFSDKARGMLVSREIMGEARSSQVNTDVAVAQVQRAQAEAEARSSQGKDHELPNAPSISKGLGWGEGHEERDTVSRAAVAKWLRAEGLPSVAATFLAGGGRRWPR